MQGVKEQEWLTRQ